ncbi:saga complex subunit spt20 [Acrodontium crateriforme]|uniref:Saga complex subunit spt20 n=1 Tax=Acrodontium crateriforme TaxID=150365 RepID=A0AAQ3RBG0_9PEZI|nr:saga complex subunit spt20 [Acrodontium crateriforme]
MATATVARASQALRQRRDGPRQSITKRSNPTTDGIDMPATKKQRIDEPYIRDSDYILKKHKGKAASLIVHLHPTHFRFDGQEGSFGYDSPMKFFIAHLKRQTVPHEMLEELLGEGVPFYDGCLIVEIHNHRSKGKDQSNGSNVAGASKDTVRFSMHTYNEHITPSALAPYPSKAKGENMSDKKPDTAVVEMGAPARPASKEGEQEKSGPKIITIVLHPTALTRHHELLILARTPATEMRGKRKPGDASTPLSGQPPTPSISVPPTPLGGPRGQPGSAQKMCIDESNFYSFQADMLVATQPPLFLDPVDTPQEAEAVLQMLSDPMLSGNKPPSPKTRKRTTAEMAADDAQAAETERRMLIMDERIKPSARSGAGGAGNENQGVAAAFGFSRFKTLEMVRQKQEEQERAKKEEEERAQRKQTEEQAQQKLLQATKQREMQQRQQQGNFMHQRQEQIRQAQMEAQRQAALAREHAHQQANGLMQAGNFPHPQGTMAQSSPIVRQQTPMINSSPMMQNGGFPMTNNPSQGAGSPPRPSSAAMQQNRNNMVRQASQQHGNQNTPQLPQGTPGMGPGMQNRQLSQTPRMAPGSPAVTMQGTPTPSNMGMGSQLGMQQGGLRPEQMAMLQQQALAQNNNLRSNSPAHANMTPEQIQSIRMTQQARQNALLQAQNGQVPHNALTQQQQLYRAQMMQRAQQQQFIRQQMAQMQANGQAGSPQMHNNNMQQGTPQMNHSHPQTQLQQNVGMNGGMQNDGSMTQQQQHQMAQQKAMQLQQQRQTQMQLQSLSQKYGGWDNIPPNILGQLPPTVRQMVQNQQMKQQQLRQQQAMRAQQIANGAGGDQQVPAGQPNPQYMQTLRQNQAMLLQAQASMQNQQNGSNQQAMNAMAMNMNMGNMGQGNQFGGANGQNPGDLQHAFANMQQALNQQRSQQNGMGGGQ